MFTGLIRGRAIIAEVQPIASGLSIRIDLPVTNSFTFKLGDSVALNGICLTVVAAENHWLQFEVSPETILRTSIRDWKPGHWVNWEPALCAGDPLGGHYVQGHVDEVAEVESIEAMGDFWQLKLKAPLSIKDFVVSKGSITIDGVSLTINTLETSSDSVGIECMIIPHTWQKTIIEFYQPKRKVNIEVDILGKYVVEAVRRYLPAREESHDAVVYS
jgi:riboflavin synthase